MYGKEWTDPTLDFWFLLLWLFSFQFCNFCLYFPLLSWISKCGEKNVEIDYYRIICTQLLIAHCLLYLPKVQRPEYAVQKKSILNVHEWRRGIWAHSQNVQVVVSTHIRVLRTLTEQCNSKGRVIFELLLAWSGSTKWCVHVHCAAHPLITIKIHAATKWIFRIF